MLSFTQTTSQNKKANENICFFDDIQKKISIPTACNNMYPAKVGWTIYGCSWCPYNQKAQLLLQSKNISYYYYDIEQAPFNSKENYKKKMASYIGNHQTTPAIFKDGKLLGGFSALNQYF
jgi:glutaredoxin